MSRFRLVRWCAVAGLALTVGDAHAVLIGSGDGTGNALPGSPPSGIPWSNVGTYANGAGPASATYLGNRYVLLTNHSGLPAGGINFPGVGSFVLDGVTDQLLTNGDTTTSDLRLVRLATDPGLPAVSIPSSSPALGTAITMIGGGRDRATSPSYYSVSGSTWTLSGNPVTANAGGFAWAGTNSLRWGTNTADGDGQGNANFRLGGIFNADVFQTDFYESGVGPSYNITGAKEDFRTGGLLSTTHEAHASQGDSGGGVFRADGSLVGIMLAIDGLTGQPSEFAPFGTHTFIADLSVYRSQLTMIPEPSGVALASLATGLLLRRRRRA